MKKELVYFALISGLLCNCKEVEPVEQPATIISRDYTYCGYCGGWFVRVDSSLYRADIPATFAQANTKVLIRYELNQQAGYKDFQWIVVKSIRQQ